MHLRRQMSCSAQPGDQRRDSAMAVPGTIPADKNLHQRQIEAAGPEIDALVYELHGLTEEEIAIVEGRDH